MVEATTFLSGGGYGDDQSIARELVRDVPAPDALVVCRKCSGLHRSSVVMKTNHLTSSCAATQRELQSWPIITPRNNRNNDYVCSNYPDKCALLDPATSLAQRFSPVCWGSMAMRRQVQPPTAKPQQM
jgi:hypothetical protein